MGHDFFAGKHRAWPGFTIHRWRRSFRGAAAEEFAAVRNIPRGTPVAFKTVD